MLFRKKTAEQKEHKKLGRSINDLETALGDIDLDEKRQKDFIQNMYETVVEAHMKDFSGYLSKDMGDIVRENSRQEILRADRVYSVKRRNIEIASEEKRQRAKEKYLGNPDKYL